MFWMFFLSCGANIDSLLVANAVHCTKVEQDYEATCINQSYWDQICTTCDEEYPWDKEYEWMPNTLDETVSSVRIITAYEQHTLPTSDGEGLEPEII